MVDLDRRSDCCSPSAHADCCDPGEKDACCGDGGCGCQAGRDQVSDVREQVRNRYAAAARATQAGALGPSGEVELTDRALDAVFAASLYADSAEDEAALSGSLGCGVPTAVADLSEGETVLDLGSGVGADVLISARRVGPTGKAIGIDMTDEMLDLARRNATEAGLDNVEFIKGVIEAIPLPTRTWTS
jgi:arsenite methyltransferase